jgi:sortase system peptidoglycan-associated protein
MNISKPILRTAVACALIGAVAGTAWAGPAKDPSASSQPSREENIGTGTGAVIGALIGGPPGFIIGAVGGNFVGRNSAQRRELNQAHRQITELRQALADQTQKLAQASADSTADPRGIQVASAAPVPLSSGVDPAAVVRDGFALTVQFRSDSSRLEKQYAPRLHNLAVALTRLPKLKAVLSGYADRRGSDQYNLGLSQRRADAVRDALIDGGLPAGRIHVVAYGERQPAAAGTDPESYGFDRRVVIRFTE